MGVADWWRFGYLVAAGSIVAPLLQILAQRELPAGRVALLFALEPVFALGFALALGRGELLAALVAGRGAHPHRGGWAAVAVAGRDPPHVASSQARKRAASCGSSRNCARPEPDVRDSTTREAARSPAW